MSRSRPAVTPSSLRSAIRRLTTATHLRKILTRTRNAEVFLVGGAVRDLLLKRRLGDLDFVVRGVPLTKLQRLLKQHGKVNLVGKNFGVLKFQPKESKQEIDIALPRTEHAFNTGGTRDFKIAYNPKLPITEDLFRRDFTVNALAINLETGELIDPSGGLSDLASRRLRTVGRPSDRFTEDFSRLARGLRFAVELGFNFEDQTWRSLKKLMPNLGSQVVPRELIAKEFLKAFAADAPKTVDLWDIAGAFRAVLPEVLLMKHCPQHPAFHSEGDVWTHARLALEMPNRKEYRRWFSKPPTLETMVALFFHDLGKPLTTQTPSSHGTDRIRSNNHDVVGARLARAILERLRISSYEGKVDPAAVAWLIEKHMIGLAANNMRPSTLERYFLTDSGRGEALLQLIWSDGMATVSDKGRPTINAFLVLQRRLKPLIGRTRKPVKPLLHGDELMAAFDLKSGPIIGQLLDAIRDAQLERKVKTKHQALALAHKLVSRRRNS